MARRRAEGKRPLPVRRATYYLRPDQVRGLKVCAVVKARRVSDMMRDAVDLYLRRCAPGVLRRASGRWIPRGSGS